MKIPYIKLVTATYKIIAQGTENPGLTETETANFYSTLSQLSQGPWQGVLDFVQSHWQIADWNFKVIEEGGMPELIVDFGAYFPE